MRGKPAKNYEMDMCSGPVLSKMLVFALPLMLSSILQLLFNAADVVVVGRFAGDDALAAVGCNGSLIGLLINLFMGISVGANVEAAQKYGSGDFRGLQKTVHTSVLFGLYSGLFLTVVGVVGAKQLLTWMQTPKEVIGLATTYLRIYFLGMTASMVYNFGSAVLRAVGDTKRPMYFLMASGVVNVILNLFFVIVCDLSVAGVAIATVISQVMSAVLVLQCLVRSEGAVRLMRSELHFDMEIFRDLLKIGLPAGLQGTLFSISNVIIQSSINSFGADMVAGNSAAVNIEGFVYVAINAIYQTTLSFTSQNMGAGNYKRIRRILRVGAACVVCVSAVLCSMTWIFSRRLLGIYTDSEPVIQAGLIRLRVVTATQTICGMMDLLVGSMRGMGNSVLPMFVSLTGVCGFRLLWIFTIFRLPAYHTPAMLFLSYPLSWAITASVHYICFNITYRKVKRAAIEKQAKAMESAQ